MEQYLVNEVPSVAEFPLGEIVCHEIPNSRTVRSFIRKHLGEWLRRNGFSSGKTHYHVTLDREGSGHLVYCQIEVVNYSTSKVERWTGSWSALGLHQALMKTLNHMMPGRKLEIV